MKTLKATPIKKRAFKIKARFLCLMLIFLKKKGFLKKDMFSFGS